MQIFLGKTVALEVDASDLVADVKDLIEAKEGTPAPLQRLLYAGRQLEDEQPLSDFGVTAGATLHLVLRLRGGKGGFGSLLRGAGKHKLVENYDACRDLQGRRIRHKTAEKKLEEWQAAATERELEKQAARLAREQAKAAERAARAEVDVQAVRQEHKQSVQGVLEAVQDAIKAGAVGNGIRHKAGMGTLAAAKRRRIDPLALSDVDEELSDGDSDASDSEEGADEGLQQQHEQQAAAEEQAQQSVAAKPKQVAAESAAEQKADSSDKSSSERVSQGGSPMHEAQAEGTAAPTEPAAAEAVAVADPVEEPAAPPEPVDLSQYESAEALQACGLDRLKAELQRHGLKAGGDLKQRAARLFLLKHTPLDKLDRKLFAKA